MVTAGYRPIMDEIHENFDDYDPWGTAIGWSFDLAEFIWVVYKIKVPEFEPSPMLKTRDDLEDSYAVEFLFDLWESNGFAFSEIYRAFRVMSRYADILKAAGKSY